MINLGDNSGPQTHPRCPNDGCWLKGWPINLTIRSGVATWHCQNCGLEWPSARGTEPKGMPASAEDIRASGVKLDEGKPLLYQGLIEYFPEALMEVAKVSEEGAKAPGHVWGGWRDVPDGYKRYTEAMIRHLFETPALEMGLLKTGDRMKLASIVAWNSLCRLQHLINDYRGDKSCAHTTSGQQSTISKQEGE